MKEVLVEVTDKGAIYIDNTRITNRSTKWGLHNIVFSRKCKKDKVVEMLKECGFSTKLIDDPEFMK